MSDTGIFWIRDDFRIENNPALSFATQNHDYVIALFIYNNKNFDNQTEAQKWWVSKSLEVFKSDLSRYNICLLYTSPSPRDKRQSRMPSCA